MLNLFESKRPKEAALRRDLAVDIACQLLAHEHTAKTQVDSIATFKTIMAELLGKTIWKYSEADGKYRGCAYWSEEACKQAVSVRWSDARKNLRHEHLFPQRKFSEFLMNLKNPSQHDVREYFDHYSIGVVVTRDEDAVLTTTGWRSCSPDPENPWRRYAVCDPRIRIVDNGRIDGWHKKKLEEADLLVRGITEE